MFGLINAALNLVQLGIMGKQALKSEAGQKAVKKTSEAGKAACSQANKTACAIAEELRNKIERMKAEQESRQRQAQSSDEANKEV